MRQTVESPPPSESANSLRQKPNVKRHSPVECPSSRPVIRWVFDSTKSPIPAAEPIRPFVASNVRVSDAPSVRQKSYGGLGQRPPTTLRCKSKKGGLITLLDRNRLATHFASQLRSTRLRWVRRPGLQFQHLSIHCRQRDRNFHRFEAGTPTQTTAKSFTETTASPDVLARCSAVFLQNRSPWCCGRSQVRDRSSQRSR